jgi:hypothetical protein
MRHLRPVCSRCIYWIADSAASAPTTGHCHRNPPGVFALPESGTIVQKFPSTDHHQWCGEWSDDDSYLAEAARRAILNSARPS